MIEIRAAEQPELKRLSQYAGFWAIESRAGAQFAGICKTLLETPGQFAAHKSEQTGATDVQAAGGKSGEKSKSFTVYNGNVAVIGIDGTITKYGSSLSAAGSTLYAQQRLRAAAKDPDITGILLHIESPGGTVAGVHELAQEVVTSKAQKPVWTYFEDIGASAAYWIGSQADMIYANEMANVGSIGVYMVVEDLSQLASDTGIKVHVIRNGDFKGAGTPGTEITDEQLANWQRGVDAIAGKFHGAVMSARGFTAEQMQALADGRVHMAEDALQLGLIDSISTLDEVLAALSEERPLGAAASVPDQLGGDSMSQTTAPAAGSEAPAKPAAATYQEIVAGCKGLDKSKADDALFVSRCLDQSLTLDGAKDAWMEELQQRATKASAASHRGGTGTLADGDGNGKQPHTAGTATEQWHAAIKEMMEQRGCSKADATSRVVAADPELHEAYLKEYNDARQRR